MKHEWRVHWETRSRYSVRSYARYFDTEEKAVAFARKKNENPLTEAISVTEQEGGDIDGVLHLHIIKRVKWWE